MQGAVLPKAQEMPVPKISTIKNVLSIGIFLAVVCYSAIYANNTFPISEGWNVNYVELIWHGKVPYRDFYYYLPPLNLLVDAVLWKLSFGSLLLYRLWWLLQRAAIFTLLFRLISRYINVVSTFVACLFSVMLCASSVYDLLGDYNQTVALLSILLLYCVIGFQEADTSKQRYTKIFGAGFMLGLVFLNKQTIFLASGIVYFPICGAGVHAHGRQGQHLYDSVWRSFHGPAQGAELADRCGRGAACSKYGRVSVPGKGAPRPVAAVPAAVAPALCQF